MINLFSLLTFFHTLYFMYVMMEVTKFLVLSFSILLKLFTLRWFLSHFGSEVPIILFSKPTVFLIFPVIQKFNILFLLVMM